MRRILVATSVFVGFQLQEWREDYEERDPGHRHISHLFALHPGNQITPRGTPDLARAARVTLERRLAAQTFLSSQTQMVPSVRPCRLATNTF
jgi:Glycosyl hydrolase family 95 catalytic domain